MNATASRTVAGVLHRWKRAVDAYALRLVEAIPSELSGFRPVETQLTFAGVVHHLAECEAELVGDITEALELPHEKQELLCSPDVKENVGGLKVVIDCTDTIVKGLTDNDLRTEFTLAGTDKRLTVLHVVETMIEHQIHHRGQVLTYFRVAGISPPQRWKD